MNRLDSYAVYSLPVSDVYYDTEFNCRSEFTPQSVAELAESIRQNGLQYPVTVQPIEEMPGRPPGYRWRIIAGHRRFKAVTTLLGWTEVPAMVRSGLSARQAALLNFTENLDRKDLNTLEEARAIQRLFPSATTRAIAAELKRPQRWVAQRLQVLRLPGCLHEYVAGGVLSMLDVEALSRMPPDRQEPHARQIIAGKRKVGNHYRLARRSPLARKLKLRRSKAEMQRMVAWLIGRGAPPIAAKALCWAAGILSDAEFKGFVTGENPKGP